MKALCVPKLLALATIASPARWLLVLQFLMIITVPVVDGSEPKTSGTGARKVCYAFLRHGNLWTVCQGKRERIASKLVDFAVSADGSHFAFQENLEPSGIGRTQQALVSLNPPFKEQAKETAYPESLYAACGTIVSVPYGNSAFFDLLASRRIEFPPYADFRCSSDRRTVVGWTEQDDEEFMKRAKANPGSSELNLRVSRNGRESNFSVEGAVFAVSPNGRYLGYFVPYLRAPKPGPGPDLCVQAPDKTSCVRGLGHLAVSYTHLTLPTICSV